MKKYILIMEMTFYYLYCILLVRSNQAPANTQGERITQGQEYLEAATTGAMSEAARHSWFAVNKLYFHLSRCL